MQEDLTPETAREVIKSFKGAEEAPEKIIKPGPFKSGRKGCEPLGEPTSLKEEPTGPGFGLQPGL